MLHGGMGLVTVRVVPKAGRISVGLDERGIVVHVRAAPERGRATEEARRALAEVLAVPGSAVELHRGARSRTKVFEVAGYGQQQAEMRLRATGTDSLPP
jgi:uncharacterized protein YggU (UPF0235/DUF167 family)